MSAAEDLSRQANRLPPSTPTSQAREHLLREVNRRCIEISYLEDGWDGRGSKRPSKAVILRAGELGLMIVGTTFPIPKTVNLGACADGFVQFAIFGASGREADLWIEDDSGTFKFERSEGGKETSGSQLISNYMPMAAWLHGDL